jgi:hypothetical protein
LSDDDTGTAVAAGKCPFARHTAAAAIEAAIAAGDRVAGASAEAGATAAAGAGTEQIGTLPAIAAPAVRRRVVVSAAATAAGGSVIAGTRRCCNWSWARLLTIMTADEAGR